MTKTTRRAAWGMLVLTAATGLSGCSFGPRYAATINDEGHVQIERCFTSADLVVESSPGDGVLQLTDSGREGDGARVGVVDLEMPSAEWTVSGNLDLQSDTVLTVWQADDFDLAHRATTTTAATTASSRYIYTPEPVLKVRVSDLRRGAYFHDGRNMSKGEWRDACDPDTGLSFGNLLLFALPFLCILFVVVFLLVCLFSAAFRRKPIGRLPPRDT